MAVLYEKYSPPDKLYEQIKLLPDLPGVYQFVNTDDKIIYIGKAKNLKKRVSSYFNKNPDSAKLAVLVRKIYDIRHLIVETESDALLLENNLIKKHLPRYNVLLKDDKTFPWICVKNEAFPRIFATRKMIRDGSKYYGPYTSGRIWKSLIDVIRSTYKIRTCKLNLSKESIQTGKLKVCLEYHIGNCLGPCINKQTEEDYQEQLGQIEKILKGNTVEVIGIIKRQMQDLAANYQFEQAEGMKERIEILKQFQAKSTIVNTKIKDVDVFSVVSDGKAGYVNFLKVVNGAIIQTHSMELKKRLDETDEELLMLSIVEIRTRIQSDAKEILVSHHLQPFSDGLKLSVPQKGDKKTLVDLSTRNAKYFRLERQKQKIKHLPATRVSRKLEVLRKDLRMQELPSHIECFDNSNTQGSEPVAACVVFKNARPSKSDYRHFNIKTVTGADDFASMAEVIFRRYKRLLDENQDLPQLVIVDGGKGQLSAAMKSLEQLNLRGKMTLIGIAKRLEEIYFPNDKIPLYLDKNSESLKLIQQLRNEAHRFGIAHHRNRRTKGTILSELTKIEGIGEKTRDYLLTEFGSVERIAKSTQKELAEKIGPAKARVICDYFKQKRE
ncbi:MAG: excinuclease ABC subunit C [Bacteroidetes bacterium]|jgi:excinuclease ABC subunit C|nr:excinuclease ABC subunit C [Bacteroidota bacterium]MBT3749407.1 excinuclease ABC subunit C [Bacteroidota bacterium]MBT4398399.1 excinuclease ABC subunit C [Bacteroidota bacterium]MBT4411821.1 excinuclease ABC subunit C [Bacteroidota bacterium]MBT7094340.1 excinuclease ABC subunit C [Bacteroidota bacterium]